MVGRGLAVGLALGVTLALGRAAAQDVGTEALPGAVQRVRATEGPVAGLVRRDTDTVAYTLPGGAGRAGSADAAGASFAGETGADESGAGASGAGANSAGANGASESGAQLSIHDFSFNGQPVTTGKVHLRQVAPGVVEITSVAWEVGYWHFLVRDAASYYGLGERFDVLDHAHTVVKNLSMDDAGVKGSSSYQPVPFFMSTTGYGLWVDTTGEATFDMNASDRDEIVVDVTAKKLRIVLIAGPEFPRILERFTGLTGRPTVPPYWAFAPWMVDDRNQNAAQVAEVIDRTRKLGLPASVILIGAPWETSYNDFKFNLKQFDDAPAMVKHIHDSGFKLVLWQTPWIDATSGPSKEDEPAGKIAPPAENYREAADQGLFVKNPDGSPYVGRWREGLGSLIDFTNPKAKQWWQDQARQAIAAGADGFEDDGAEGSFIDDVTFSDGTDPRLMRNRYAVLYNNAVEELIQKDLKGNGVLLARSSTAGENGTGFLTGGFLAGGDNESSFSPLNGLPTVVTAGLGAGLSGMPLWTAGLGGDEAAPSTPDLDARLMERWTEYAAFSPVMEVMSSGDGGPLGLNQNSGNRNDGDKDSGDKNGQPGGDEALAVYRKYATLHMNLFPYRYAAAEEAARTGMPILRALVLQYQNDALARASKDEYLFGPDFLVAPVIDAGTQRTVYLPPGQWVDYWTGEEIAGGKVVVVDAPLDTIPVWARAGAIIPKIPDDVMTLVPEKESGNATVKSIDDRRVYEVIGGFGAGAAGSGDTEAADTSITDFEGRVLVRTAKSLKISGGPAARVTVRWRFGKVASATVNGVAMPVQPGADGPSVEFDYAGESLLEWH